MVRVFGFSSIKYFVLLIIYLINVSNGENVCVDCSKHIDPDCVVKETAIKCTSNENKHFRTRSKEDWPHLEECLLKDWTLFEDLHSHACSMSPDMGCKVIANKNAVKKSSGKERVCKLCNDSCRCKKEKNAGTVLMLSNGCFIAYILAFVIIRFNSK